MNFSFTSGLDRAGVNRTPSFGNWLESAAPSRPGIFPNRFGVFRMTFFFVETIPRWRILERDSGSRGAPALSRAGIRHLGIVRRKERHSKYADRFGKNPWSRRRCTFKPLPKDGVRFTPARFKALVNEKFMALCREFGPDNIGLSTGDALSEIAMLPSCVARRKFSPNIVLREGAAANVQDVVMDEFHYYATVNAVWRGRCRC